MRRGRSGISGFAASLEGAISLGRSIRPKPTRSRWVQAGSGVRLLGRRCGVPYPRVVSTVSLDRLRIAVLAVVFLAAVAVALEIARPFRTGAVGFDSAA